jgi:SAM-dependent methyltransferase
VTSGKATYSRSQEAVDAYERKAEAGFESEDPRDQYSYMYSKMRADYTLMERVGVENAHVLNVGCSFPVDEIYYARKIARWVSVDISRETLRLAEEVLARELHPELAKKFAFEYADACDLPFEDDTFDVSVSMSTFDHLPTAKARQMAVDQMARTTRPGGWVIVTVANRWCLPYALGIRKMMRERTLHYGYAYLYSPPEIRRIGIQAGLEPVHFASSISPPDVWLPGYPLFVRVPARLAFTSLRYAGYLGRRIGYAFRKPVGNGGVEE